MKKSLPMAVVTMLAGLSPMLVPAQAQASGSYDFAGVTTLSGSANAVAVDTEAHRAYVAIPGADRIDVIDTQTNSRITSFGSSALFQQPSGVALDTTHHMLYVSDAGSTTARAIDTSSVEGGAGIVSQPINLHEDSFAVATDPEGGLVYFAIHDKSEVRSAWQVVRIADRTTQSTLVFGGFAGDRVSVRGTAVDTSLHIGYLATTLTSSSDGAKGVVVANSPKDSASAYIGVGRDADPHGIAVDSTIHRAYVALTGLSAVGIIDTSTNTVLGRIQVNDPPVAITVDSTTHTVFSAGTSSVSVIDVSSTSQGAVVATLPGASNAQGAAVDTSSHTAYVANSAEASLSRYTPAAQSIRFTSTAPSPGTVGDVYDLTATGGASGNPVVFSIDPSSTRGACTVDGSRVSFWGVGTCVIDADQSAGNGYAAAPRQQQIVSVIKKTQTVTFTSSPPSGAQVGDTYAPTASGGGSENPVVFSSGSPGVCSVDGDTVRFDHVGSCVIDADQDGDDAYAAAPTVEQSVVTDRASQAITFTSPTPADAEPGDSYTPSATGGQSGNDVVFSSASPEVCSVDADGAVQFDHAGSCVLDADQAGNDDFAPAPTAQQSVAVGRRAQAITFTSSPPQDAKARDVYVVTATGGGSGNAVEFSSGSPEVCTVSTQPVSDGVSSARVKLVTGGLCSVRANQEGSADFSAAAELQQSFDADKASQVIRIRSTPPADPRIGSTYLLKVAADVSRVPVTYSVDPSSTEAACTVEPQGTRPARIRAKVSFTGVGTCVIAVDRAGNDAFYPAPTVRQSIEVGRQTQSIAFTSKPPRDPAVGSRYVVRARGGQSGNPVTFSLDSSSTPGACSVGQSSTRGVVSNAVVSLLGEGSCVVDADQAGDDTHDPAPQRQQSFLID